PLAVAPNFIVDGRECIVPLAVEEPSIVAALSSAARLARAAGGFDTECDESLLIGQVHLSGMDDAATAMAAINDARGTLMEAADAVHPRLVRRGGGVRDLEVRQVDTRDHGAVVVVHLLVDTRDAMGANLVNTMCEALAPELAALSGGQVALRILSNLVDRSLVTATVRYPLEQLANDPAEATAARDAIVLANDIAMADPYRAATHNKGIMNGIDAVAIATGNDWRAIEAGAHAYAAIDGSYRALTEWRVGDNGDLVGRLRLPLKVATVGGTLDLNAAASLGLRITGVQSATGLARIMAAVGLAQNFSAIRALATSGIQHGHMRLHARSVAASVGTPDAIFEDVVSELIESGDIKDWKAREILAARQTDEDRDSAASSAGKVILLGEHAVVYGKHALALPVADAMRAIVERDRSPTITIPDWGIHQPVDLDAEPGQGLDAAVALIRRELGIGDAQFALSVRSRLPRAMGLGSSAALAVAIVRALAKAYGLEFDDERTNAIAFECERLAHGTPSGVDNTLATYAKPMLFRRGESLEIRDVELSSPPPIIVACSKTRGMTVDQVEGVRARREVSGGHYDALFERMDEISLEGSEALRKGNYERLGALMDICQGLLNAIGVSTPELERMVTIARGAGALGAKLTGAGGGGSMIALAPGRMDDVEAALSAAGFETLPIMGGETK
ncbi:MAG: hydroxymethylglutaryl-CoA reductase, degradative, partial [Woeseiaceae bacterium]|nr:hydroxymethylglutaryl-CoA reductase, degradative [Woeseiaceae bacterium]